MNNTEVVSMLKNLIKTCSRGQNGFQNAAESIQNDEFRRLFNIFSQQRVQFMTELQSEVNRLGGDPSGGNRRNEGVQTLDHSVRFQISPAKKSAGIQDEATVVKECQSEEEAAVNDYQDALKTDLPLDVQYVVKRQYMDIKDAFDRIRILQRAA